MSDSIIQASRPSDNYVCFQIINSKKVIMIKAPYSKPYDMNRISVQELIDFLQNGLDHHGI